MRETAVDVRIIAATNENLLEAIRENKFRGDLFHRLDEFTVQIPPLRERKEDIPAFAESFLQDANRELEKQIRELEDTDIIGMVRENGMTMEQFAELFRRMQAAPAPITSEQEEPSHA